MTRAEIEAELERVQRKMDASLARREQSGGAAESRIRAIQAPLEELNAMVAEAG